MTVKNFGIFILKDLIYIFINIQLKQTKTLPVVIKIRIRRHRQSSIKWVKIFQKKIIITEGEEKIANRVILNSKIIDILSLWGDHPAPHINL